MRDLQSILIADDEHLMATGLASSLASLGYRVVGPYADGRTALEAAESHRPDLLVLDIRMPELDGLEVARAAWEQWRTPSVLVTAYSAEEYIAQAQQTGVFGYLLKPVSTDNLRVTVSIAWARAHNTLEQHERIDQLERSLHERRIIEQAKWKLVEERGMSEPKAHAYLQQRARNERLKLLDVAQQILDENSDGAD